VRRGAIGGAVVHRPDAEHVAYTLGMALAGRRAPINDVAIALREIEPSCAAACAGRKDRMQEVVPVLRRLHERSVKVVDNLVEVTALSRMFHEAMVDLCGNQSLAMLAGALESLWSSHEAAWADRARESADIPRAERLEALDQHRQIIDAIAEGDTEGARTLALEHLLISQFYPQDPSGDVVISPIAVRSRFTSSSG
jgi:GntR family transcriptional repressor for pyruvate dehydrogenase complex